MDDTVLLSVLVLGGIAVVSAVVLYLVSRKFAIAEDIKIVEIDAVLPQANCGGCGKAGCHDFAQACAHVDENGFSTLYCPVGGQKVMDQIAALRGFAKV